MSLIFTGFYGQQNTGDDAFCVVADWGAKHFWSVDNVIFHSRNLPVGYDGKELNGNMLPKKLFAGQDIVENTRLLNKKYSHIVYAGGSILHKRVGLLAKERIISIAKKMNKISMGAIGVSLGPFESKEAYLSIKEFLSKCSFVALRDQHSFELAQEMNLNTNFINAFDLAALLPDIYGIKFNKNSEPTIGVSICEYERFVNGDVSNEKRRFDNILECLKLLHSRIPNLRIKLLIINNHKSYGDNTVSFRLKEKLPRALTVDLVEYSRNPQKIWNEINSCDAIIATRLHAGIFACFSNTPFVQIEYHRKCTDLLNDLGYKSDYRIGDFQVSPSEVSDHLLKMLESDNDLVSKWYECRSRAKKNFTETQKYLPRK